MYGQRNIKKQYNTFYFNQTILNTSNYRAKFSYGLFSSSLISYFYYEYNGPTGRSLSGSPKRVSLLTALTQYYHSSEVSKNNSVITDAVTLFHRIHN